MAKPRDPDRLAEALQFLSQKPSDDASDAEAVVSRACPVCGQAMQVNRAWGTAFNVCPEHGTWLERGQLRALIASIRPSGKPDGRSARRDSSGAKPFAPPPTKGLYV